MKFGIGLQYAVHATLIKFCDFSIDDLAIEEHIG